MYYNIYIMKRKLLVLFCAVALAVGFGIPATTNANINLSAKPNGLTNFVDKISQPKTFGQSLVGGGSLSKTYQIYYQNAYVAEVDDGNENYTLKASRAEELIALIDADRFDGSTYQDCTLEFLNITIGEDFMTLANGNYVVQGQISANSLNTKGVFAIDGGNVRFENATLVNNGFSALVKNTGAGDVEFLGGSYTAQSNIIVSTENSTGDIIIQGGSFESLNGYVIRGISTKDINVQISQSTSNTILTATQTVVLLENGTVQVFDGKITGQTGIKLGQNAFLTLQNSSNFDTQTAIETKNPITSNTNFCTDDAITIKFDYEIQNGDVAVYGVSANVAENFVLHSQNSEFKLKLDGENLTLNKILGVTYHANGVELTDQMLQQMDAEYFAGDMLEIEFFDEFVRDGYIFKGFATTQDGALAITSPYVYAFSATDLELFAVFEARVYQIIYELGDGVDNSANSQNLTYTVGERKTINAPIKEFYDFLGFKTSEDGEIFETFTITEEMFGDLTLIAVFELHEYQIEYIGVENFDTTSLKTTYTIADQPYQIKYTNLLGMGYSLLGAYLDQDLTQKINDGDLLNFDTTSRPNPQKITIYLDVEYFHNGEGFGTKQNPFLIENSQQFMALLSGQKATQNQYIALANNIQINQPQSIQKTLENIFFDGNNFKITFNILNNFENYFALIPSIKNCHFSNVVFKPEVNQNLDINQTNYIGLVFGNVVESTLKDITAQSNSKITLTSGDQTLMAYISAFVARSEILSTLDRITLQGYTQFDISATGDSNVYAGGISGAVYSSLLINSQNQSTFVVKNTPQNPQAETLTFIAPLANVWRDSIVANSFASGAIWTADITDTQVISSGLANVFADGVSLKNLLSATNVLNLENTQHTSKRTYFTSSQSYVSEKNVLHFDKNSQNLIESVFLEDFFKENSKINNQIATRGFDATCDVMYYGTDMPSFNQSIKINFDCKGVLDNKTVFLFGQTDVSNVYYPNTDKKYFFGGWFLDKKCTKKANLQDVSEISSITVYAKFTAVSTVVNNYFMIYVAVAVLLLAGLIIGLYFFDRKKPVKFFNNGKLISEKSYARTQIIEFPEGFDNTLWFSDVQGQTPFVDRKMPHKSLNLYTFNESKQKRVEGRYYQKLEEQNQANLAREAQREKLLLEKQQQRDQRKKLSEREQELRLEKRKKLLEDRRKHKELLAKEKQRLKALEQQKKQELEKEKLEAEERRKKQKEVDIDGKITVIKKEIKILSPRNKDDGEK